MQIRLTRSIAYRRPGGDAGTAVQVVEQGAAGLDVIKAAGVGVKPHTDDAKIPLAGRFEAPREFARRLAHFHGGRDLPLLEAPQTAGPRRRFVRC